jgi:aspartyl-tRNA(Asn)/glutamyl-tRNA(Gln) amidotransferase subunit C
MTTEAGLKTTTHDRGLIVSITKEEVQQIAVLARLALKPAEIEEMAASLSSILDHIVELAALHTEGVPPMGGVSEHPAPMREDQPGADPLHLPPEELAPAWEERFFLVPRLASLDADALLGGGGH